MQEAAMKAGSGNEGVQGSGVVGRTATDSGGATANGSGGGEWRPISAHCSYATFVMAAPAVGTAHTHTHTGAQQILAPSLPLPPLS